ncbi:MAG TPA: fused MFS/spermidine synthase [Thermoanaerobaculia bacterium]|nr:fused MFS/spermidine synthase [Thermoanaerobaculia bacterium]
MPKSSAKTRKNVLYLVVFFTNLLSLACQVIWVRKLSFLFGSTAGVFSTVLSVFLLGLAVGALVAGRLADRTGEPWKLLARVQIALGVYVALSLPIFDFARRFYLQAFPNDLSPMSAALWKFAVVLVVLIAPTLAIGATFPLAVRLLTRGSADVGGSVSLVYGLDTMGAALGALLSGFVFVTGFGLSTSTWMLGALSVILGLWILGAKFEGTAVSVEPKSERRDAASLAGNVKNIKKDKVRQKKIQAEPAAAAAAVFEPPPSSEPEPWPAWRLGLVLGMFFLSGLAALLLETGWNRLFYLMNGTSVYSLSSVLTGFLTGIGLGSLAMRRRIDRIRDPLSAVAITYAVIALGGVLVLRSGSFFERMYLAIFAATNSYFLFQILVSLVIAGIVFCATVAMGANFPLVTKICTRVAERRGFAVGRVFFWNTLGAVLGAFLGEFWLLPRFGFAGLGLVTLVIYALGALLFLGLSQGAGRNRAAILCAALLAAAVVLSPVVLHFELPIHAVYYHGLRNGTWENFQAELAQMKVIDEKQGFYGQVAVLDYGPDLLLKHNGKTDASTNIKDNRTQILLGHLPLFFHPNPKQVLAIGLGGGATLRALTHNPDLESITMVEIDPLVTRAARTFFGDFNDHALDDPRVRIVTNDGRNYVDSSRRTYDVISSEPPNIWVAGVSGLFTQEFYRSAKAHLNPGGILCQWMPLYEMQAPDFRITLHTIQSVFPNIRFWAVGGDIALVASELPLEADEAKVRARLAYPGVLTDLREIEMTPDELLGKLSRSDIPSDRLPSFIGRVEIENTDDLPILEFSTAQNLYTFAKEK